MKAAKTALQRHKRNSMPRHVLGFLAQDPSGQYRPDIDGLRAVAVMAVILYHAGVSGLSGGYVGVDVFFVISGFLITRNIVAGIEAGNFRLVEFYHRRARRLLPALFVTILMTLVFSLVFLRPEYLRQAYDAAIYAVLSASNIYFWLETDYFGNAAHTKPLLHTWSLAVEEQFYLIWPALLLFLMRWPRPAILLGALLTITVVSIVLSEIFLPTHPAAVFYLLPFRMGELAIGAMCVWLRPARAAPVWVREAVTLIAFAAIAASIVLYTEETPFPGVASLPPVLATAAIIALGASPVAGAVLSWRPVVAIGLISYSMYLVHWPILVFLRAETLSDPSALQAAGVVLVTIAVSTLMYWVIERPVRKGLSRPGALRAGGVAAAVAVSASVLITVAAWGWTPQAPQGRTQMEMADLETVRRDQARERIEALKSPCNLGSLPEHESGAYDLSSCLRLVSGAPDVLIIGSSYATGDAHMLRMAYPEANVLQLTSPGCLPRRQLQDQANHCGRIVQALRAFVASQPDLGGVIISHNWRRPTVRFIPDILREIEGLDAPSVILGPRGRLSAPLLDYLGALEAFDGDHRVRGACLSSLVRGSVPVRRLRQHRPERARAARKHHRPC